MDTLEANKPSSENAIKIIENIVNTHGPGCGALFVGPNMILTLAGGRMFGDGVFYHPDKDVLIKWKKEISQGLQCIDAQSSNTFFNDIFISNPQNGDLGSAVYNLYNIQGFMNTVPYYSFLAPEYYKELLTMPHTNKDPYKNFLHTLSNLNAFKNYSREQIMHIAFGIYLGYPEKAILGSLQFWNNTEGKRADQEISAHIEAARHYSCPVPIYTYPRDLINEHTINNHEKLWSNILQEFYNSAFHKQLRKESDFLSTINELATY